MNGALTLQILSFLFLSSVLHSIFISDVSWNNEYQQCLDFIFKRKLQSRSQTKAYLDYKAWEAQIGWVCDIDESVVGILAFVLQFDIHHHPSLVSVNNPKQCLRPCSNLMATENATRLHRMSTELSGRQKPKLSLLSICVWEYAVWCAQSWLKISRLRQMFSLQTLLLLC